MASIYTTIEEYIKYENNYRDNRINRFLERVTKELPENLRAQVKTENLKLEIDKSYPADNFVRKYRILSSNPEVQIYLNQHTLYISE